MANLVCSPGDKVSPEEQRLHLGRRQLVVSLLAYAWLWGRPKVLDNRGNPVAFEKRRVLAPQAILDFLDKVRAGKASCTDEEIRNFLLKVPEVHLHEDTSKWNVTGLIACLRWDKSHDLHDGGPWCSCRLERDLFPPPYGEVFPTKSPNFGVAGQLRHWLFCGNSKEEKRAGCEVEMPKALRLK
jgi:hypothetical protein